MKKIINNKITIMKTLYMNIYKKNKKEKNILMTHLE